MLKWSSSISARLVCSHERYNNFFCSPGRTIGSERLYGAGKHQSSLPRVFVVVYRSQRRCRRRGDSETPIEYQTVKTLGDGLPYLGIGRTQRERCRMLPLTVLRKYGRVL